MNRKLDGMGTVEKNRSPLVNSDGTHTVNDLDLYYANKDEYKNEIEKQQQDEISDWLREINEIENE
jgi:hypothetical protein